MRRIFLGIGLASALACPATARADLPPPREAEPPLRLYLDCSAFTCDFDFLHRELAWVDWVRDRSDADVVMLLSTRETGPGGTEVTISVERPRGGGPVADTLRVFAPPTASDDEGRRILARAIEALVARDLAGRPEAARLRISVDRPADTLATRVAPERDRWNHWVYRLGTQANAYGESGYGYDYVYSSTSATRVTERWRMGAGAGQSYSENRYTYTDGTHLTTVSRSWNGRTVFARSLSPHLSAGVSTSVSGSSYTNIQVAYGLGPAIEWSVYPYDESSRRAITFGWQPYVRHNRYEELTLFGKLAETLFSHELDAGISQTQTWGSISLQTTFSQYLHDTRKYRLFAYGSVSLKLLHGLSIDLNGNASRIHDQIALPRGSASESDVLTRQHQLATSYQFYVAAGLSYRFGSIYDSIVNTRLMNTLGGF